MEDEDEAAVEDADEEDEGASVAVAEMSDEDTAAPNSFTKNDDLDARLLVELLRTMPAAAADLALIEPISVAVLVCWLPEPRAGL